MLNYHKILSQTAQTKTAKYSHFLTLGSHISPIRIQPLLSLSIVTLYSETKLVLDKQKTGKDCLSVAIPIDGNIRINERVFGKNQLVFNPKYINEIDKKQTSYIYLAIKSAEDTKDKTVDKLEKGDGIKLSEELTLKKQLYKCGQFIQLNKRILILPLSGKFSVVQTKQQIAEFECLYTRKGCGKIEFLKDSQLLLFQFMDCTNKSQ